MNAHYDYGSDLPTDDFDPEAKRAGLPTWSLPVAIILSLLAGIGIWTGVQKLQSVTAHSPYVDVSEDIRTISSLMDHGQYTAAASLARFDLSRYTGRLAPVDEQTLADDGYKAEYALLMPGHHTPGDIAGDNATLARYRDLESFARQYTVDVQEPLSQVETDAWNLGYYPLARTVWLERYAAGQNRDGAAISHYYSILTTYAMELLGNDGPQYRTTALRYLEDAVQVGHRFGLPRNEAGVLLRKQIGRGWPPPAIPDPLLRAAGKKR